MHNIYSNPEKFGLRLVDSGDRADSYEFDIFAVFRNIESGQLSWTKDSGCSCPTPFEEHGVDDLTSFEDHLDPTFINALNIWAHGWEGEEVTKAPKVDPRAIGLWEVVKKAMNT